jgi:hypothetical protein
LLPFSRSVTGCIDDVGCENNTSGGYQSFKSIIVSPFTWIKGHEHAYL